MRKRIENRLRKAIRISEQLEPSLALRCRRLERSGRSLEDALAAITMDREAPSGDRWRAAELLDLARHPRPFSPLIDHFLDCDWATAWDLVNTTGLAKPTFSPSEKAGLVRVLRQDPVEERRAATAQF